MGEERVQSVESGGKVPETSVLFGRGTGRRAYAQQFCLSLDAKDAIFAAVLNESGRPFQQPILATRAAAIPGAIAGVRGVAHVTFEEGTHSAWFFDLPVRRGQVAGVERAISGVTEGANRAPRD
jgi:hypothetical protein